MDHPQEVGYQNPEPQLTLLELQSTREITWMKFEPDLALQLIKKKYVLFKCSAVLYCMAYDLLK